MIHLLLKCTNLNKTNKQKSIFLVISHNMHLPDSRKASMKRAQRKLLLMVDELNQHWLSLPPVSCFVCFFYRVVIYNYDFTLDRYTCKSYHQPFWMSFFLLLSFFLFFFYCQLSQIFDVSKKEMMLSERGSFHQACLSTQKWHSNEIVKSLKV